MRNQLILLIGGTVLLWLALLIPGRLLTGDSALIYTTVAAVLCLVPTAATLAWSSRANQVTPEQHLLTVLGGTGARMFFVLGGGLGMAGLVSLLEPKGWWNWSVSRFGVELYSQNIRFREQGFWMWVLVFYLLTLALEIGLLLRKPASNNT